MMQHMVHGLGEHHDGRHGLQHGGQGPVVLTGVVGGLTHHVFLQAGHLMAYQSGHHFEQAAAQLQNFVIGHGGVHAEGAHGDVAGIRLAGALLRGDGRADEGQRAELFFTSFQEVC